MATYYWVGGAGTWDATTTTRWATSSGGAGGAGVPTSADNVIFDSASNATAYAVTVGTNAVAADITIAGPASGNVTITTGATAAITCYGSWTNSTTGVVFAATTGAIINFASSSTGKIITTNNVSLSANIIIFNGVGGGWTLGSAFSSTGSTTLTSGSFNTNNFAFSVAGFNGNGTLVRSLTLGSSIITLSGSNVWVFTTTTNLTFNAGTSTIVCSGAAPTFAGGGLTYYNVSFTSIAGGNNTFITGSNTFNNLTQASPTNNRRGLAFGSSQTVTGTFTPGASNLYNARVQVQSTNLGSKITLTVATVATLLDVDFRDITIAGASSPWAGVRLGNGLGNTNITFVAGKTVYWNLAAGGNWGSNAWALTSGGAVATANFPLAQDTAIIDNTGLTTGNTITMEVGWWVGTFNCTRTNAWTFAGAGGFSVFGNFTIPSVTTVTYSVNTNFVAQGLTQTITSNGVTFPGGFNFTAGNGTVLLNGALTISAAATFNIGTLDLNNYTLTCNAFSSSNSNNRILAFGTGKVVVTGGNSGVINLDTATNFSFTGSGAFEATYSGSVGNRTLNIGNTAGGSQAVAMNIKITAGTDIVLIYAHWNNVDFTGFSGSLGITGAKNYYGSLTLSTGMTLGVGSTPITFKATSGIKTITSNGQTMDFPIIFDGAGGTWSLQDNMLVASSRTTTLTNGSISLNSYSLTTGIFSSNNANSRTIDFGTGKIVLTATDTSPWIFATTTNLAIAGTSRVEIVGNGTSGQTRSINHGFTGGTEANSPNFYVLAGADNVSFTGSRTYGTIDFYDGGASTFTGNFQSDNWAFSVYGNLVLSTSVAGITTSSTFTGPIIFAATSGTKTITTAGKTYPISLYFNGVGGTWQLQDALTLLSTEGTRLINGSLLLNGYTLTIGSFQSSYSNIRTLTFSNGTVVVTGSIWQTPVATNFTTDATGTISMSSASPKTFAGGGSTWSKLLNSGAGTLTITGANTFMEIGNSVSPASFVFPASTTTSAYAYSINGTASNLVSLRSSTPGTQYTLAKL